MRAPDLIIGPPANPYMLRWVLWRWRGWQLALHRICRSDDDRALHDHVGDNLSFVLSGTYEDMREDRTIRRGWPWSRWEFRRAETAHRLILPRGPVWTLWLRWPPRREWGFHCPKGWRHNEDYTNGGNYYGSGVSTVGRGCDD